MKKISILTFLIAALIFQKTNAQILRDFGMKGGISISKQNWTYSNDAVDYKLDERTGLIFAVNLEWFNNNYITFVTDIGYIQKGFNGEILITHEGDPDIPLKVDTRIDYLYFNPQLKIRKEFKKLILYAFFGPRIDYELFHQSDFQLPRIEEDIEKIIFGANYGLGIAYRIKEIGFSLEFAHFYDFTDIINIQPVQDISGLKVRDNAFTIGFGINYYLSKKDK